MAGKLLLVGLSVLVGLGLVGCSATYYHSKTESGYRRSEFGLLGAGGPGGVPGLIPLYRENVELEDEEQD